MNIIQKIKSLIIKDKINENKKRICDLNRKQCNKLKLKNTIKISPIKSSEPSVLMYLKEKLKPLLIEVLGEYSGGIFDIIETKGLRGWCWESTQTCSIFLNNDDYIERGDLYIDQMNPEYYHSWICFKFNNKEYVFDPCLDCLCLKKLYYKRYQPQVKGCVKAIKVKEKFYYAIKNYKVDKESWIFSMLNEETKNRLHQEIIVKTIEDVNEPFYRGNVGYRSELKDNKLEKLTAHYYMSGFF